MRKLLALVLVLGLIVALSACTIPQGEGERATTPAPNPSATTTSLPISKETIKVSVTREQAIDIALGAAGLSRQDVYDLEAELDRDRGGVFWEVDFETRDYDYSYDIHSETGAITRTERERD